jgi:hypothetical protein
MERVGLGQVELRGLKPRANPITCVRAFRARARGEIDFRRLAELLGFGETSSTAVSYMGRALRTPAAG